MRRVRAYEVFCLLTPALFIIYSQQYILSFFLIIPLFIIFHHSKPYLFLLLISFFCGSYNLAYNNSSLLWLGLKSDLVCRCEGVSIADSTTLNSGSENILVRLTMVEDKQLHQAQASGALRVYCPRQYKVYQGEILSFWGSLIQNSEDDSWVFNASCDPTHLVWKNPLYKLRTRGLIYVKKLFDRSDSAALVLAIFLGIQDNLSLRMKALFRQAGVSHILALSGMHIGILVGIFFFLLKKFKNEFMKFVLVSLILGIYIFFAGFRPSLTRAFLFFIFLRFFKLKMVHISSITLLSLCFLLMLILSPSDVYSLSFQLSFSALFGILFISNFIPERCKGGLVGKIILPLFASLGAQIATLPLILFYFGRMYPVGLLSSLIVTPIIIIYYCLGVLFYGLKIFILNLEPVIFLKPIFILIKRILLFFGYFPFIDCDNLIYLFPLLLMFLITVLYKINYEYSRRSTGIKLWFQQRNKSNP